MMKKLALLLSLCVMVLAVSTTVFAEEPIRGIIINTNKVEDRVEVTINGSDFTAGEQVGILVLKPGVNSPDEIDLDDPIDSIDYIDQVEIGENKEFTLTYTSSGQPGQYKVYYTGNTQTPELFEIDIEGQVGAISGKITSLGNISAIAITVLKDGQPVKTANPDAEGNFSITGLEAGTYSVEFVKKSHLKLTINGVEVKASETKELGQKALIPGDINGDALINIEDLQRVLDRYGSTESTGGAYDSEGDLNDDTLINIEDLQAVLDNYGKTAASYEQ